MLSLLAVLALQTGLPEGYATKISVVATSQGCKARFHLADGSVGRSDDLPRTDIGAAFDELMQGNMDADAEANIEPLQRWGKKNAGAIEAACARSAQNGGAAVTAVN
jgi:hypothetical protein